MNKIHYSDYSSDNSFGTLINYPNSQKERKKSYYTGYTPFFYSHHLPPTSSSMCSFTTETYSNKKKLKYPLISLARSPFSFGSLHFLSLFLYPSATVTHFSFPTSRYHTLLFSHESEVPLQNKEIKRKDFVPLLF
jgi:hypothetical protein